jgi:hypothetical protein
MGTRPAQPPEVIDAVFNRLSAIYGARFHRQHDAASLDTTKRIWAQELAGISPAGIRYAMANLPSDYPPNPLQIRALAANRPPESLSLPPPRQQSPEGLARLKNAGEAAQKAARTNNLDPLAWAKKLRDREQRGERLKPIQARLWRQALRLE